MADAPSPRLGLAPTPTRRGAGAPPPRAVGRGRAPARGRGTAAPGAHQAGTGSGRRALARRDFEAAAREALSISGAELLDARPAYGRGEMVVQYRFRQRRLECVVDRATLRVSDAGICLTDEHTGERGDSYFTLESLPPVVGEAIDRGVLVVYRHVWGE